MATKRYLGLQVRQIEKHAATVSAVAVGGVIGITINSKSITYTCVTGDTVATAASNLANNIRAAVDPEFQQFSTTINSAVPAEIDFAVNVAGQFLSADGNTAFGVVSTGGATITDVVSQKGLSPSDGGDPVNWSGGALPLTTDDWWFEDALFPMLYRATTAFTGLTPASINVRPTFTGNGCGLPKFNLAGYPEYLGNRVVVTTCTKLNIELPAGAAFEAYRFNTGSNACALTIRGNGSATIGQEAVEWIGANGSNAVEVIGGSLRAAPYIGDTATIPSLKIVNGAVTLGAGVTLTTALVEDGALDMRCGATTLTIDGPTGTSAVVIRDTAAVTTLTVQNGTCLHNSSGNITTAEVGPGATLDFSGGDDAITITNTVKLHKGCTLNDPNGRVTFGGTPGWTTVQCALSDVTVNVGLNRGYNVT